MSTMLYKQIKLEAQVEGLTESSKALARILILEDLIRKGFPVTVDTEGAAEDKFQMNFHLDSVEIIDDVNKFITVRNKIVNSFGPIVSKILNHRKPVRIQETITLSVRPEPSALDIVIPEKEVKIEENIKEFHPNLYKVN